MVDSVRGIKPRVRSQGSGVRGVGPIRRVVNHSRRQFLQVVPGIALAPLSVRERSGDDPPVQPANWRSAGEPRVAVAGAGGAFLEEYTALIGGFTDRLEAPAGVQVPDPRRGWLPIGNALLEARAEPVLTVLDHGSILVLGGWTGRLPQERRWLPSAEICEPLRPERRRPIPPPFGPDSTLEGASAIRLADGRVFLVHQRQATLFDPKTETWSTPFPTSGHRIGAALATIGPDPDFGGIIDRIVVVGGHRSGEPPIETITIPEDGTPSTVPWPLDALPVIAHAGISESIGGVLFLAGGETGNRSVNATWQLDPRLRSTTSGPDLPIAEGISRPTLIRRGNRLLVVGGESLTRGTPTAPANGAVIDVRNGRTTSLPPRPLRAVRSTVVARAEDVLVVGGYRFQPDAPPGRRTQVLPTADRLVLPRMIIED